MLPVLPKPQLGCSHGCQILRYWRVLCYAALLFALYRDTSLAVSWAHHISFFGVQLS